MTTAAETTETFEDTALISEEGQLTAAAYEMTSERFASLKVVERDVVLFLLLRDMAGTIRSLDFRADELEQKLSEYESKAKELASPEGIQELMNKFLGGGDGMGSLLGGMFR